MIDVIPAIIPKSALDLAKDVEKVKEFAGIVQVDIIDGKYAPSVSWPYVDQKKIELPFKENIQYEIDLMVSNPEDVWRKWVSAGASRIIIHLESTDKLKEIIDEFRKEELLYSQIGIALGVKTNTEEIYPYLEDIDFVQCMGSPNIGHHGEVFDEKVLEKIADIKKRYVDIPIGVDIGMNEETIPKVLAAGASRVAVGSALFGAEDIKSQYEHLSSL
ncbi:MAG: hypothetical protein MRY49_00730 [Candidatus Pacebacteria bacterium]|nr:hypothetical protein [Candidatus Paceibacterota bacterium]